MHVKKLLNTITSISTRKHLRKFGCSKDYNWSNPLDISYLTNITDLYKFK